ncbi:hypothetical protein ACFWRC_19695 [Streptomyces albidoflavus]
MTLNLPAEPTMTLDALRGAVHTAIDSMWLSDARVRVLNLGDRFPGTDGPTVTVVADKDTVDLIRHAVRNGGVLTASPARLYNATRMVVAERTEGTREFEIRLRDAYLKRLTARAR